MSEENRASTTLDLDDLSEPGATLIVGGETYHYVRWSGLGLLQRRQITRRQQRMDDLEKLEDPTDEQAAEYDELTRELLPLVSDVPPKVSDGLESEKRQDALSLFLALRLVRRGLFLAAMKGPTDQSTTETPSRGSKGSGRKPRRKRG